MSDNRTDWEIGATKAYAGCPERLVIATGPEVFWKPESGNGNTPPVWDPDRIREVMEWTDFFQSRDEWNALHVFCTEYPRQRLLSNDLQAAWAEWAQQVDHLISWELELWLAGPYTQGWTYNAAGLAARPSSQQRAELSGQVNFYPAEFGSSDEWDVWQEVLTDYFENVSTPWRPGESLTDLFKRGATTVRYDPSQPAPPDGVLDVIILEPAPDGQLQARAFELPYRPLTTDEQSERDAARTSVRPFRKEQA